MSEPKLKAISEVRVDGVWHKVKPGSMAWSPERRGLVWIDLDVDPVRAMAIGREWILALRVGGDTFDQEEASRLPSPAEAQLLQEAGVAIDDLLQ